VSNNEGDMCVMHQLPR